MKSLVPRLVLYRRNNPYLEYEFRLVLPKPSCM